MRPSTRANRSLLALGSLGLSLAIAACQAPEKPDEAGGVAAQDLERRSEAIVSSFTPTADTLIDYAAACDAATGIHVPRFNCSRGTEVPEGTAQVNLNVFNNGLGSPTAPPASSVLMPDGFNVETITAGGGDIWNSSDGFYFYYANLAGDGMAEVLVTGLTQTDDYAKAGLMFREGTGSPTTPVSPTARHVMVALTPRSGATPAQAGVSFQNRSVAGQPATNANAMVNWPIDRPPTWLRIVRVGSTFTATASLDRITWTPIGQPVTLNSFPATAQVGLAVSSHTSNTSTVAIMNRFSWMGANDTKCDRPNVLNSVCDPGSRFQVLVQNADAAAVAHCRKKGSPGADEYVDIAVIQYNKANGAVCFYQNDLSRTVATLVNAPSEGNAAPNFQWQNPGGLHGSCDACHDNGGFIRSPYLEQMHLLPSWQDGFDNYNHPMNYVGTGFLSTKTFRVSAAPYTDPVTHQVDSGCGSCHSLAVSTAGPGAGTAESYALTATDPTQSTQKNPHSPTSPVWMRPDYTATYPSTPYPANNDMAHESAKLVKACAELLVSNNWDPVMAHAANADCNYSQSGGAWVPAIDSTTLITANIGATPNPAGTYSSTDNKTVTMAAAGAGVGLAAGTATTDDFFLAYTFSLGDGFAQVQVTGLDNASDPTAKAGLMFRSDTTAGARNVFLATTPTANGVGTAWSSRLTSGAATTSVVTAGKKVPMWLRIVHTGNTFTGYYSPDLVAWTQIGAPVTLAGMTNPLLGLAVSSHKPGVAANATFKYFTWTSATGNTFSDANIGVNAAGVRNEWKTSHTISSSGGDIQNNADVFHYTYKTQLGDGVAVTRVSNQVNTDPYAKAGLMFRDGGNPGAMNAMVAMMPSGATFQNRLTTGGATTPINITGTATTQLLRLSRVGSIFTGSISTDNGTTWTAVGSPIVFGALNNDPLFGFAVSSHNGSTTSALFDNPDRPDSYYAPSGYRWTALDSLTLVDGSIGMTGGTRASSGGTETISAAGADIFGASDQFFYSFRPLNGNGTIIAKVVSLTNTNAYSKAGLMIRDGVGAGAVNAMVTITPGPAATGKGASFQYRTPANPGTTISNFSTGKAPAIWLKLVRAGTTFTGYTAPDVNGMPGTWTSPPGFSATISPFNNAALVGLAVTSHVAGTPATAVFSDVSVQ